MRCRTLLSWLAVVGLILGLGAPSAANAAPPAGHATGSLKVVTPGQASNVTQFTVTGLGVPVKAKPRAVIAFTGRVDSVGRLVASVTTNATKVKFRYKQGRKSRAKTIRVVSSIATFAFPVKASKTRAQALKSKKLRASRTVKLRAQGSSQSFAVQADTTTIDLGGGARLIIPPGAMTPGATVTVTNGADPAGSWGVTSPLGQPIHLTSNPPGSIRGLLTLEFPVTAAQLAAGADSAVISTLDEGSSEWTPVTTVYDAGRGLIIAQIPHFSWWNPSTWNWDKITTRVNQNVGQLLGKRSAAPTCKGGQPSWVAQTVGIQTDAAVAIRACAQSEGEVLDVQITNNRPYGMVMKYGSSVKWGWHEAGSSALDIARNKLMDSIMASDELYIPPLGRASVGIHKLTPNQIATFRISLTGKSLTGDVAAEVMSDLLVGKIPTITSCGAWALGAPLGDNSAGAVRDAVVSVGECLTQAYKDMARRGLVANGKVSEIESTIGGLKKATVVGRLWTFYGIEWKLADLWADHLIGYDAGTLGAGFSVRAKAATTEPPVTQPPVVNPPVTQPPAATITVNTCATDGNCDRWNPIWIHSNPSVSSRIADAYRGQQYTARCWAGGRRLTDGNDSISSDDPIQFTSSLWYGIDYNGGRGYVPAVWTTKREDHLGLPGC